jgi:hypothetical protein
MINQDELAICRRRGHQVTLLREDWMQCPHCGMWVRARRVLDEREDEPPENEIDPAIRSKRMLDEMKRKIDGPNAS